MITVNLNDKHLQENLRALKDLKDFGYSDEELQTLYDRQVKLDTRSNNNDR